MGHSSQLWSLDAIRVRAKPTQGGFWPAPRSAIVGEIIAGDQRKAFNFRLGGGDRHELFENARKIETWAKSQGGGDQGQVIHVW
jgi:hypothetical protein